MVQSAHSWCTEELSGSFLLVAKRWYLAKMRHSVFHLKSKKERLPENILYTCRDLRRARSVMWLHLSRSDHQEWNNERRKGTMCLYFAFPLVHDFLLSTIFCTPGICIFSSISITLMMMGGSVTALRKWNTAGDTITAHTCRWNVIDTLSIEGWTCWGDSILL